MIEVRDLTVQFGEHRALDGVTVSIPDGSITSVMGRNGSGKSTFLRVLLGILTEYSGKVSIQGVRPDRQSPFLTGYVPQVKSLDRSFPARCLELVLSGLMARWPLFASRSEITMAHQALERVGAGNLALRSPGELSGGELQRVYLARSLVRRPRILMLDEPSTGIDQVGEMDMYHILEEYHRESGATILMVTHDIEAAAHHSTHVLLLNRHLVGSGPVDTAMTEECLRKAFGHEGHSHGMAGGCQHV